MSRFVLHDKRVLDVEDALLGVTGFGGLVGLREIVPAVIGMVPLLGGIFSIVDACFIFRGDQRCIHDLMANTKVIRA